MIVVITINWTLCNSSFHGIFSSDHRYEEKQSDQLTI